MPGAPAACSRGLFFFFQAEDGIRDKLVTGVQTCALPIFQPKKSLLTGHTVGVEALARWNHRQFGFMMPGSFMSAIRFHGLDHALLVRMMEDAMSAHLAWRSSGYVIPVSVNLPIPLLDDIGLPDELHDMAARCGIAAENITFELLEDQAVGIPANYYMCASRLRLKGFGLAQDDYGRGYSSMYS